MFGSVAGVFPVQLNEIVTTSATSYDGLAEVCDLWLEKCRKENTSPTWHAVEDILTLIGYRKMADDLLQVYSTGIYSVLIPQKSGS